MATEESSIDRVDDVVVLFHREDLPQVQGRTPRVRLEAQLREVTMRKQPRLGALLCRVLETLEQRLDLVAAS